MVTTKIIRYDKTCQIVEENDSLVKLLDDHLSYWVQGAEFSKAYRGYYNGRGEWVTWDGHRHLMTNKGAFPNGLFERVIKFYSKRNKPVEIIDQRQKRVPGEPIDIFPALEGIGKKPYPYQLEAAKKAVENDCGVIRVATGGGKTLIAGLITSMIGKKTVIYVIGKDLLKQIHGFFEKLFGQEIGFIGDGKCEIKDINVATIWSVGQALGLKKSNLTLDDGSDDEKKIDKSKYRAIKEMLLTSSVHIFDECHLAACDTVQEISRSIKSENIYGMSASPWRDDGADLLIEAVLGNKVVDIPAKWLIDNKYLVRPEIRFVSVPKWKGRKKASYQTIYKDYIVESDERNDMVATATQRLVEQGFVPLVLFHSIKHGEILREKLQKNLSCGLLSGKDSMKERDKVQQDLLDRKIDCIIASKIFDIGIDIPMLSALVPAGGGKSSVRALQRIGRVIRKYPNKEMAAVVEFADQARYLLDHSKTRCKIYEQEFEVSWPKQIKR